MWYSSACPAPWSCGWGRVLSLGVRETQLVRANECERRGGHSPSWEEEEARIHLKAGQAVQRRVFLDVSGFDVKAGAVPGAAQPLPPQDSCNRNPLQLSGEH